MKNHLKFLATVLCAAALVACGGGGGGASSPVAAENTTLTLNAANGPAAIAAISGQGFSFPGGVPALGTTNPTTLTITTTAGVSSYSIRDNVTGLVATGTLQFGSCVFKQNLASPFPILAAGDVIITPCSFTAETKGKGAGDATVALTVLLGNIRSDARQMVVSIDPVTGVVKIGNVTIGTATLVQATGTQ